MRIRVSPLHFDSAHCDYTTSKCVDDMSSSKRDPVTRILGGGENVHQLVWYQPTTRKNQDHHPLSVGAKTPQDGWATRAAHGSQTLRVQQVRLSIIRGKVPQGQFPNGANHSIQCPSSSSPLHISIPWPMGAQVHHHIHSPISLHRTMMMSTQRQRQPHRGSTHNLAHVSTTTFLDMVTSPGTTHHGPLTTNTR